MFFGVVTFGFKLKIQRKTTEFILLCATVQFFLLLFVPPESERGVPSSSLSDNIRRRPAQREGFQAKSSQTAETQLERQQLRQHCLWGRSAAPKLAH